MTDSQLLWSMGALIVAGFVACLTAFFGLPHFKWKLRQRRRERRHARKILRDGGWFS